MDVKFPQFEERPELIEALRATIKAFSTRGLGLRSYKEQAVEIEMTQNFRIETENITNFANGKVNKPQGGYATLKAMWDFCNTYFPSILLDNIRSEKLKLIESQNSITKVLHEFISNERPFDRDMISRIRGSYVAYRSFFLNESEVMVMSMNCGLDSDPDAFSMKMSYPSLAGPIKISSVSGRIIPYERSALFLGKIDGAPTPYIFIMSSFVIDDGMYSHAEGAVLVGSPSRVASAGPMSIFRCVEEPDTGVYEPTANLFDLPGWRDAARLLKRGFVRWN